MHKLFEKNIKFFYNNLPEYYNLIKNIKSKNYKIINDNIVNIYTQEKIYPNSIIEDSKKIANTPTHNNLWERKFAVINPIHWNENEFPHTGKAINELIKKAKNFPSYNNKGFYFDKDFLPSTAIFGLLSGKHLDLLVKNYSFHSLFVYEPNPEFFAISLYFVDYKYIYKKLGQRFFLWVNGTLDYYAIEKFFYERIVTSSFLNLIYTSYSHPLISDAKEKFEQIRISKFRGWGTFEDEKKGVENHFKNINKFPIFTSPKKLNIPFCIVANGKSLEKNLPFIKKNQNSMIIISVGTAINPLLTEGIQSDFHIEQERIDLLKEILKEPLKKYQGYFLGASVVNPEVFKYAKKPLIYVREGFTLADKNILIGSSPIVGNSGFAFASMFTDEIYLCGMDLGFRLNERKHTKNSYYDNKDDIAKSGIKIKGNFSNDIYTDSLLLSSKRKIENMIKALNLKVYNLSDGAYIEYSTPLKDKTLPKINKNNYIKDIVSTFSFSKEQNIPLNFISVLKQVESSLKHKTNNLKEITGVIDFLEDVLKSNNNPEIKILKGSMFHYLFNIYILSHKLSKKDFTILLDSIKISSFFPKNLTPK
ncbi:motility associated factor glycosyltransferase family protein [Nautilia lithotrophica]